ncbi:MAG: hypothetical protein EPN91_08200 [Salinibacterium sp.]|nr:MAG: hypothetical protein EPN91_08200 [Salinibacterium sp.]
MPARAKKTPVKASTATVDAKPLSISTIQHEEPTAALSLVQPRVTSLAAQAQLLKITDAVTEQKAASMLVEVVAAQKVVKEKLETITKPLNAALKAARDVFAPATQKLAALETTLRQNLIGYKREAAAAAERLRLEAARKADEAAAAGDMQAALEHATEAVTVQTPARVVQASAAVAAAASNVKYAQVASRKRWTFRLVNIKKVPREYLELNEKMVRAAIASKVRHIDGLEIYEEDGLAVGGR